MIKKSKLEYESISYGLIGYIINKISEFKKQKGLKNRLFFSITTFLVLTKLLIYKILIKIFYTFKKIIKLFIKFLKIFYKFEKRRYLINKNKYLINTRRFKIKKEELINDIENKNFLNNQNYIATRNHLLLIDYIIVRFLYYYNILLLGKKYFYFNKYFIFIFNIFFTIFLLSILFIITLLLNGLIGNEVISLIFFYLIFLLIFYFSKIKKYRLLFFKGDNSYLLLVKSTKTKNKKYKFSFIRLLKLYFLGILVFPTLILTISYLAFLANIEQLKEFVLFNLNLDIHFYIYYIFFILLVIFDFYFIRYLLRKIKKDSRGYISLRKVFLDLSIISYFIYAIVQFLNIKIW